MANVIDPRIALLNSIADTVPPDYYRADGTELRFYAYAWFHGQTCINVGKGTGPRFLEFFVNPDYNTLAAHDYVRQHHGELEVFFVNAAITETAAFAVEYQLIEYFRRQSENGTLYNVLPGHWPPCPSRGGAASFARNGRASCDSADGKATLKIGILARLQAFHP